MHKDYFRRCNLDHCCTTKILPPPSEKGTTDVVIDLTQPKIWKILLSQPDNIQITPPLAPFPPKKSQVKEQSAEDPKASSNANKVFKAKFQTFQGEQITMTDKGLYDSSIGSGIIIQSILDEGLVEVRVHSFDKA